MNISASTFVSELGYFEGSITLVRDELPGMKYLDQQRVIVKFKVYSNPHNVRNDEENKPFFKGSIGPTDVPRNSEVYDLTKYMQKSIFGEKVMPSGFYVLQMELYVGWEKKTANHFFSCYRRKSRAHYLIGANYFVV